MPDELKSLQPTSAELEVLRSSMDGMRASQGLGPYSYWLEIQELLKDLPSLTHDYYIKGFRDARDLPK